MQIIDVGLHENYKNYLESVVAPYASISLLFVDFPWLEEIGERGNSTKSLPKFLNITHFAKQTQIKMICAAKQTSH